MALQSQRVRRNLFRVLPIVAAMVLLLVSLVLVSDVQQEGQGARTYLWVLVLTLVALAVLMLSIISRVASLVRKVRSEEPGARLAARWVRNFLVFSLPPALVVYFFSAYFLTRTIDNWFDVQVETALQDSLQLGQAFLDTRTLEVRNQVQRIAESVSPADETNRTRSVLLENVRSSGPVELSLINGSGSALATASFDPLSSLPDRPDDYALLQALERGEYAAAEPTGDGGLIIRVLQRLPAPALGEDFLLQAIYPLPESITALTSRIESEYFRYKNVAFLRNSLKQSFILILTLVLSLTVLLAILAALSAARRMVTPLSDLALATRRVAAGDLDQAVASSGRDEIGFLAASFNDMSRALVSASDAAEQSREKLQAQGEVPGDRSRQPVGRGADPGTGRPAGEDQCRSRVHPGASTGNGKRSDIASAERRYPLLTALDETISRHLERGHREWQEEIRLEPEQGKLVLLARGSVLPADDQGGQGQVVVFDDVTVLNQAQRDAAWAEVARRLAHEVKNPLTPIRLAAERLRMKLMDKLDSGDADMLDRSASTIVAQVEALRRLVDAFGDYARAPELERQALRLDELIAEVCHLYRQGNPQLALDTDLVPGPDSLHADAGQLRQLLHNLISNAQEATPPGRAAQIHIQTRVVNDERTRHAAT